MMIFDPGVSGAEPAGTYPPFDRGLEMGVFIRNGSGLPFVGRVWNPVSTVWPDFTHPNATEYWTGLFSDFYEKVPLAMCRNPENVFNTNVVSGQGRRRVDRHERAFQL